MDPANWLHQRVVGKVHGLIGVPELWLIDPEGPIALVLRAIEGPEFVLTEELDADGWLTSPLLPGLTIRVGELVDG